MKLKHFKNFFAVFILAFSLSSCDEIDIAGLIASSDIEERYNEISVLKDYNAPVLSDENNYSFIVMSDLHYHDRQFGYFQDLEDSRAEWYFSFVIASGDLVQNGKAEAYELIKNDIKRLRVPFYPVIGNHDIYNGGFENYKKYFGRTIYDFKINGVHYIFIDTANGTLGEYQKNWLEKKLKDSGCSRKLIFSHYSPLDDELESATAMSYPDETYYLIDLCDRYNVDFFICGHLHNYDNTEIRGTRYISLNDRADNVNCFLKIVYNNGKLTYDVF